MYMAKFYIKKNVSDQYYWILKAKNGETVAKCSEYHPNKATAKASVAFVKKYASNASVVDQTGE